MSPRFPTRRRALRAGLAAGLGLLGHPRAGGKEEAEPPPVRRITRGPKHHWFGYYDKQELILSFADVAGFGPALPSMAGAKHKFNHLLFNPDGSRFAFLHRWTGPRGRQTRLLTATPEGKGLRVVDDNGMTSHYIWRDARHLLAYSEQPSHGRRFYLFEDGGKKTVEVVGKDAMTADGHCSYLPGGAWILNDTYPDLERFQHVYVYHVKSARKVSLGRFAAPAAYSGEWRCDTHPRFSPDGRSVVIDAPHGKFGRQLHLIDVSKVVG